MKKSSKIIIGIIGAIVLLAIVMFAVTLKNSTYQTEDKPENIAFNYLFAIQHKEYERAYGYLSPNIDGYPKDVNAFIEGLSHAISLLGDSSATLEIDSVNRNGARVNVNITIKKFDYGGILGSGYITEHPVVTLQQDINGEWKIIDSRGYWGSCWTTPSMCGIGPTPTPSAQKGTITIGTPENPTEYIDFGEVVALATYKKSEINDLLGETLSNPFYVCPNVRIALNSDQNSPSFTLFFDASQEDEGKVFRVVVYPPSLKEDTYISSDISFVPTNAKGKFFVTASYVSLLEQPKLGEYEIQLVFTGCEIYTEKVTWR